MTSFTLIQKAPDQVSCDLAGEAAILNLKTGIYYRLNPVGAYVWNLLSEPSTVVTLRDSVVARYQVAPEECERDLFQLLNDLAAEGLIERNAFQAL